jgi:Flp pilus assembly pilin Flp
MMSIVRAFFADESGVMVSAELVTVATVGVVAMTAGLSTVSTAVNDEFCELAKAIRSLDQSYEAQGKVTCSGYTATSKYTQQPVAESIAELCCDVERKKPSTTGEPKPTTQGEGATSVIEVPAQILPGREVGTGIPTPADAVLNPQ